MKVDNIFILYENSSKIFKSYSEAYFNSKQPFQDKRVFYVFTPTMQRFQRVCEIEKACRDYFINVADCDYFDIITGVYSKQLKLIEEI